MSAQDFTVQVATQRRIGGALVAVGGVDVADGELRVHVGVGHPGAGRPAWLAVGRSLTVPGWGALHVRDVDLAAPGRGLFSFEPEPGRSPAGGARQVGS